MVLNASECFYYVPSSTRVRKLEKKLEENKIKEQKEAQDLEAMVQHVEQNLQLMTVNVSLCIRSI